MKVGHFIGICCAGVAAVGAGLLYWDMQDGEFSLRLLTLPIMAGVMAVAFLLFPGGSATWQDMTLGPEHQGIARWQQDAPPWHRKVWLGAFVLSVYLSQGASQYQEGKPFFTLGNQLTTVLSMALAFWLVRWWLRR